MGRIKDNFKSALKKGMTKASLETNAPTVSDLKLMLKNSVNIELKKKKKEEEMDEATTAASSGAYVGALTTTRKKPEEEMDEATAAANAGAFVAPLGFDPRFKKKKKKKKEEVGEATTAASAGQYSTPKIWAKNEKNWRGKAKTQWPGGSFVKVKKRCNKFPYCNQGDINALDITENKKIKTAIEEVSNKTGKNKKYVKELVKKEIEEIIRRSFYKSPITSMLGPETKMNKPIGKIFTMGSNVGGKYE